MNSLKSGFAFFCLLVLVAGCSRGDKGAPRSTPTTGLTTIWVDETFAPIVNQEIEVFEGIYKYASVIPWHVSEVQALNALLRDSTQLALSTRKLTPAEHEFLRSHQRVAREIHVATDALAIIVHPSNPCVRVTTGQLKDIFTGKLVFWNQLDPSFPRDSIKVLFDHPESSTVRYMVQEIAGTTQLAPSLAGLGGNAQVLDYIKDVPNSMGILGVSWVSNTRDTSMLSFRDSIKVLEVSRASVALYSNSFFPYQYYMATRDYPLLRDVYLILSEPWNGLATGFASFMASDRGQRIILKSGIFPATQPIRAVRVREEL